MSHARDSWLYAMALLSSVACGDVAELPAVSGAAGSASSAECKLPASCPVVSDPGDGRTVSLRAELVTTLQRNCTDRQCHGSVSASGAGLYLGAELPGVLDTARLLAETVDVPSRTAPELPLIAPGDPDRSFLLLKVEGCQASVGVACVAQPGGITGKACGDTMPQAQRPVCDRERALLRTWILQGANDN